MADATPSATREEVRSAAESIVWILCCALASGSLGWTVFWASRGFDFTDEGFYLNWISHPGDFSASTSYFGYVYHPLYDLVRGDLFALRVLNIVVTWGASVGLVWSFLGTAELSGRLSDVTRPRKVLLSLTLGSASLLNFVGATATPNYNTLAFQGAVLLAWGLVVGVYRKRLGMWSLAAMAVGGWLAFLGKPPTAAALFLLTLTTIVSERQLQVRRLVVLMAFLLGAALATLALMGASPQEFVDGLRRGFEYSQLLGGHPLNRLLRFDQPPVDKGAVAAALPLVLGTLAAAVYLARTRTSAWPMLLVTVMVLAFGYGVAAIAAPSALVLDPTSGLLVFWLVPAAIWETALAVASRGHSSAWTVSTWMRAAVFALMPICYALGSNNNYWAHQTRSGLFLVLAGIVVIGATAGPSDWSCLFPMSIASAGITLLLLVSTIFFGYRQAPYSESDAQATLNPSRATVMVSSGARVQLDRIARIADRYDITREVGMIDLSGDSPGYIYALGARPLGLPWLIGGYPGSDEVALRTLEEVPCRELGDAWIIVTKDGDRPLSRSVTQALGIAPATDYASAGTIRRFDGSSIDLRYPVKKSSLTSRCREDRLRP